jgi:hypothetical protein
MTIIQSEIFQFPPLPPIFFICSFYQSNLYSCCKILKKLIEYCTILLRFKKHFMLLQLIPKCILFSFKYLSLNNLFLGLRTALREKQKLHSTNAKPAKKRFWTALSGFTAWNVSTMILNLEFTFVRNVRTRSRTCIKWKNILPQILNVLGN